MPKFEQSQKVQQFADEFIKCDQSVLLDTDDDCETWIVINHDGNEISLSVRNWKSLTALADIVLKQGGV